MLNQNSLKTINSTKETVILKTWLAIVIVVVVAIIAGIIILKFSHNPNSNNNFVPLADTPDEKNIVTEVHSYNGEIIKLNADNVLIKVSANKNYLTTDAELTVRFNDQTKFITLVIPKQLTGNATKDQIKKETVDKKSLKVGQNIFAMSSENIMGKTDFTAEKIEIQIVK